MDHSLHVLKPILSDRLEDFNYLESLGEKIRNRLIELPISSLNEGFCHGDFHGWNVHVTEDKIITAFDFDCCGIGWRAYDMAVFRWGALLRNKEKERWPSFLRGYREIRTINELEIEATRCFTALRHYWFLGVYADNGKDWGYGKMDEHFFNFYIKFLHDWESEYL